MVSMRSLADYHTHTRWSHGRGSVADNLLAAEKAGLEEVGISEHGPNLLFAGVPRRRWPALKEAVARARGQGKTRLLFNIEANVVSVDGEIDVPPSVMPDLDMLLVGLHPRILPAELGACWPFYGMRWLALLSRRQRHLLFDTYTKALVRCVERYQVDIIVHPGYGLPIDSRALAQACASRGTRLEINCKHIDAIARDIALAAEIPEVEFVFGSDAHAPWAVGRFEAGCDLADRLGLDRERIVNVDWKD